MFEQAIPQPEFIAPPGPQLFASVSVFTSQPLEPTPVLPTSPSQLPKPALQVIVHEPAAQAAAPFCVEQTAPQPAAKPTPPFVAPPGPQFVIVFVLCSQPSVWRLPLQSAKPAAHTLVQAPFVQTGITTFLEEQTTPQPRFAAPPAPQLLASASVFTSQPLEFRPELPTIASQLPKPALHVIVHDPAAHAGVPFCVEQMLPQPAAAPCPPLVAPPGPQFMTLNVDTSQPVFSLSRSQSAKPATQVPLHTPPPQVRLAT